MQEYVFENILEVRVLVTESVPAPSTDLLASSLTTRRRPPSTTCCTHYAVERLRTAVSLSVSQLGHIPFVLGCSTSSTGFDRLMAILCKTESIRDVIAFPKTGTGTDLLFKSPAKARKAAMEECGIQPL